MKKSLFRIHSWVGIVGGLLLFIVCWSGTFAVVSNEIDWLLDPALRVTPGAERMSWGEIETIVRTAYPDKSIDYFTMPETGRSAVIVGATSKDEARLYVYVDPYTGDIQGARSQFNVHRFFRSFHMNLFNGTLGYYTVYLLSFLILAATFTPLVFYKRWWRGFAKLAWNKGLKAFWRDAHKLVGVWSLWFGFVIALTGLWYLFEAVRMDIVDGKVTWAAPGDHAVIEFDMPSTGDTRLNTDALFKRFETLRPDMAMTFAMRDGSSFYVEGQAGHLLVRDRANKIYIDESTGEVIFDQKASEQPLYWRWSDTADPLHFGDFAGLWSKLIWFVFGLGLSGLCLTGAWLHAQRLLRGGSVAANSRWSSLAGGVLATAAILIGSFAGGLDEARNYYGPIVDGQRVLPTMYPQTLAFIILWVALTLAILFWWVRMLWKADKDKKRIPETLSRRIRAVLNIAQHSKAVNKGTARTDCRRE